MTFVASCTRDKKGKLLALRLWNGKSLHPGLIHSLHLGKLGIESRSSKVGPSVTEVNGLQAHRRSLVPDLSQVHKKSPSPDTTSCSGCSVMCLDNFNIQFCAGCTVPCNFVGSRSTPTHWIVCWVTVCGKGVHLTLGMAG